MASELRVNSSTNRSGLGTITYTDSGPIISGVGTFTNGLTVDGTQTTVKSLKLTGDNYNANWFKTTNKLRFNDNAKATFGTSDDLSIWHNGTHTYIQESGAGALQIRGANLILDNADGSKRYIDCNDGGSVELYHNNVKMFETSSTGIDVTGKIKATSNIEINADNMEFRVGAGDDLKISHTGSENLFKSDSPTNFKNAANNETIATFTPNGNVVLYHNNTARLITDTTGITVNSRITASGDANTYINVGSSADTLDFFTGGSNFFRFDSSGRMLLNTFTEGESTADDLTIATSGSTGITLRSGTGYAGNILFSDGTSGDDEQRGIIQYHHNGDSMRFFTNATEKVRIDSSGNVMFGTTSNSVYDDSSGSGVVIRGATGALDIMRSGDHPLLLNRTANDGHMLMLHRNGVNKGAFCIRGSAVTLELPANTEKFRFHSGGGISFNGDTSTANALDDYEEGSWTPHLVSSAANMSTTSFTLHQGTYTKIGRLVYITGVMYGPRSSGGTGNLRISNLPFTVRNGDHTQLLTKDYQLSNYPTNFGHISGYGMNNGTQINLFKREGSSQSGLPLSWWSTSGNDYMYFNLTYTTDT